MPKIIGGSLAEHREQTRDRLFAALASLMAERRFDTISLAEIAAEAGIGRTAVYNHFPDREALLLAYITRQTETYVAVLERNLTGITDPVDQLRAYIAQQVPARTSIRLAPGPELRSVLSPHALGRAGEHVTVIEAILRRILDAGIRTGQFVINDVDTTVLLVSACLSGRGLPPDEPERGAAIAATETFVLRAVGAQV